MDQIEMEISIPPISINPAYENAVCPLTKNEFSNLINSIREKGLQEPIILNIKGEILDGHHRFRACQKLGIEIPPELFRIKKFNHILEEKIYVREVNLLRRHQTPGQRAEQALEIKADYEKLAKLNMSKGGLGVQIRTPLGRVNKHLADLADIKLTQFNQYEYGFKHGSADQRQKLLAGLVKPNKLYGQLRNNAFLKKQIALNKKLNKQFLKATSQTTLWVGDCMEQYLKIEPNSINLIHTDPPYDEAHIYLYDGLGKISMEVLKPGGSLITYINQSKLFTIGYKLENAGLKFWWPLCLKLDENAKHSRMFNWHTEVDYKILLWFVKGDRPINPIFPKSKDDGKRSYLGDLMILSEAPDKRFHNFGQSPKDAEYVMKYLTAPNDSVLDPFVGGGSTAVACMNMKRRFIGIDIDPNAIELTNANLRMNYEISSKSEKV